MEYCLAPVTTYTKDPPRQMNIEQIAENSRGTWPTITSLLGLHSAITTADVSLELPGSLSQESSVPSMGALQTSLYSWYPLTTLNTVNSCIIFHGIRDNKINNCGLFKFSN